MKWICLILMAGLLVGCRQVAVPPSAATVGGAEMVEIVSAEVTPTAVFTQSPTPFATNTPGNTPTQTPTPTPMQSPTQSPSATPAVSPTATPVPTPVGLPAAPNGWEWELLATAVPITHYITTELYPDLSEANLEYAYGPNDEPIPGIGLLPRTFLLETAYQGSGKLPNGNLLEHAETRAPVERGLVPFRFVITPHSKCDGYPIAGNSTCSVPFKTAATTWKQDGPLVPVGSRVYIVELGMKVIINDVAMVEDGPHKIDLYTGYVNNYHYERPDGSDIWVLVSAEVPEQDKAHSGEAGKVENER